MNAADWIILAVIAVSVAQAAMEGFFHQAFGLAGLVFGYILAAWRYQRVADWLAPHVKSPWLGDIAGFLLIFLGSRDRGRYSRARARWAVKEVGLSFFDRILGGALGLVRGALMVAIVLLGMTAFTPTSRSLEGSSLAPYFQVIGRAAIWVAPSALRARFYRGTGFIASRAERATAPEAQPQTHSLNASATADSKTLQKRRGRLVKDQLEALILQMYKSNILYAEAVREFKKRFILTVLRGEPGQPVPCGSATWNASQYSEPHAG